MSTNEFLILFGISFATILACRVIPLFLLKGRELSPAAERALELIPPAAFAALVANDLCNLELFEKGTWDGLMPMLASLVVAAVALRTRSLIVCVVAGVGAYLALTALPL